jgi:hypothetical protein
LSHNCEARGTAGLFVPTLEVPNMLTPEEAYEFLVREDRRGLDDPQSWYPIRWYFGEDGVLRHCAWRSACPTMYPEFVRPAAVTSTPSA